MEMRTRVVAAIGLFLLFSGLAFSQQYPIKPIKWIIPWAAGGPTDGLGRVVAPKLGDLLGVPVIVENRPGAGGNTSAGMVAKALPDGYTMLLASSGILAVNPHLYAKLPYDTLHDFTFIASLTFYVNALLVNSNRPEKSVGELIAYAKANPGKASFGSGGVGTGGHLAGELLKSVTGAPMIHVPYKGNGPAMADLLAGNITCMFDILSTSMPQVHAGKLRMLAVTSAKRSTYVPEIPTIAESGVQGYVLGDHWYAVVGPAGLPSAISDRLRAAFSTVLGSTELKERFRQLAFEPWTISADAFPDYLRSEYANWGKLVKLCCAKAE